MKIFIVGFMCVGKTSVGRKMAEMLSWPFLDTDLEIEERYGDISEIFKQKGEEFFRRCEREILKEVVLREGNLVVSCGGGLPCYGDNMALMLSSGRVVYLSADSHQILEWIKEYDTGHRPLLENLDNPSQWIEETLKRREEFYNQADVVCPAEEASLCPQGLIEDLTRTSALRD